MTAGLVTTLDETYDRLVARNPGEREFHQAAHEVLGSLGPVLAEHPDYAEAQDHRAAVRARAADHLPGAVAGRPRRGARQPRLPGRVQLGARPVQGRAALPPVGRSRHRQVPRLRADLQERAHRPADRRRQGRRRLRPERPVGRRGHAVLPVLHDRAVPAPRRAHRRTRRATSASAAARSATCSASTSGSPTATSPASSPARGPTGAAPRYAPRRPATARVLRPGDAQGARATRSTASGAWCPAPATSRSTRSRRSHQLGGQVVACSDSDGYVVDEKGIDSSC